MVYVSKWLWLLTASLKHITIGWELLFPPLANLLQQIHEE